MAFLWFNVVPIIVRVVAQLRFIRLCSGAVQLSVWHAHWTIGQCMRYSPPFEFSLTRAAAFGYVTRVSALQRTTADVWGRTVAFTSITPKPYETNLYSLCPTVFCNTEKKQQLQLPISANRFECESFCCCCHWMCERVSSRQLKMSEMMSKSQLCIIIIYIDVVYSCAVFCRPFDGSLLFPTH